MELIVFNCEQTEEPEVKWEGPCHCSCLNSGNIPRLFFNLYFGCGALGYSLLTLGIFLVSCFGSETFGSAGMVYMLVIAGLMWLSTILTVVTIQCSLKIGKCAPIPTILFTLTLLLKVGTDAGIFYVAIEALRDPNLNHFHEFSQFVGPLIYFGLLYLVTIIEMVVILTTIAVMEDRCGIYAMVLKVQKSKATLEAFIRAKFPVPTEV